MQNGYSLLQPDDEADVFERAITAAGSLVLSADRVGLTHRAHLRYDGTDTPLSVPFADRAQDAGVAGLVCLGYPFHPPGTPEKLRTILRMPVLPR